MTFRAALLLLALTVPALAGDLTVNGTLNANGATNINGVFNAPGKVTNADLTNSSIVLNGHSLALGNALSLNLSDLAGTLSLSQLPALTTGSSLISGDGAGLFHNVTIGSGCTFTSFTLACSGSGGTVGSVGLSLPSSIFTVTGSPVTSSGTLAATLASQTANQVWAGPSSGSAATPAFRSLVLADLPSIASTNLSDSALLARLASPPLSGTPTAPTPSTADSSTKIATTAYVQAQGYLTAAPVASVFGRTGAVVAAANDYSFSQLSGSLTCAQRPALTGDVTAPAGSCATTLVNIPAISGANLTSLNASNLTGTINNARLSAVPNSALATSAVTINGTSVSLGGTRTLSLASADFANQGTSTTVLHGNASGNPTWSVIASTVDVTFSAGNYGANGGMTWTVTSGEQTTYKYQIVGKMMTVWVKLDATAVGGSPSGLLQLTLPSGIVISNDFYDVAGIANQGSYFPLAIYSFAGWSTLNIAKQDFSNWATGTTYVFFTASFPIN